LARVGRIGGPDPGETATRPDFGHAGSGLSFYRAAAVTGGATQLAVITTPSHMILPSRRCVQGRGKTLDADHPDATRR
jgi:hypothetical protein